METINVLMVVLVLVVLIWLRDKVLKALDVLDKTLAACVTTAKIATASTLTKGYLDDQARSIQKFLERFLGRSFNVQCNFIASEGMFNLWIWKQYENRDMGVQIQAQDQARLLETFMRSYYTTEYLATAEPFPDK